MEFLDWAAAILGAILIVDGIRAIRCREVYVPERYAGDSATRLGCLWLILGIMFVYAVEEPFPFVSRSRQLTDLVPH